MMAAGKKWWQPVTTARKIAASHLQGQSRIAVQENCAETDKKPLLTAKVTFANSNKNWEAMACARYLPDRIRKAIGQ
jgi:hypothetical protein